MQSLLFLGVHYLNKRNGYKTSISKIFPKWHKHHKSDISDVYEHEVIKDMSSFKDTET